MSKPMECENCCPPETICDFCQPSTGVDYPPEDEYAHDLFWHALNYRTAHPMDADRCWGELQDCVNRLIKRGGVWE